MNIFVLDINPVVSAQSLMDIHTGSKSKGGKMIVEGVQMLANCFTEEQLSTAPKTQKNTVRKYSYYNHPCSIWVRQSLDNYWWLLTHTKAMIDEKLYRGGNLHFCNTFVDWASDNLPDLPEVGVTKFALAMPEKYKCGNFVASYRRYYTEEKRYNKNGVSMFSYTRRKVPEWWNDSNTK